MGFIPCRGGCSGTRVPSRWIQQSLLRFRGRCPLPSRRSHEYCSFRGIDFRTMKQATASIVTAKVLCSVGPDRFAESRAASPANHPRRTRRSSTKTGSAAKHVGSNARGTDQEDHRQRRRNRVPPPPIYRHLTICQSNILAESGRLTPWLLPTNLSSASRTASCRSRSGRTRARERERTALTRQEPPGNGRLLFCGIDSSCYCSFTILNPFMGISSSAVLFGMVIVKPWCDCSHLMSSSEPSSLMSSIVAGVAVQRLMSKSS